MAVTIQTVNRGTVPGDGTGDTAYDGAGKINTSLTNLKAAADLVLDVPQNYMLGRITASTGDVEQLTSTQVRTILDLTTENGFVDRADSTISFTDGTLQFSISPAVTSYDYWSNGIKYTKSGTDNVNITDVEGLHFIYFNGSTLTHTTTFSDAIITDYAFVAAVYWDATNNASIILADERHGHVMDSATHLYHHHTVGAQYASGLGLGNMQVDGTGASDADAQFSVLGGRFWDEDIEHTVTDGSPQTLSPQAQIPVLYRSGASGDWRIIAATNFPLTTTGTGLAAWNEWTGATWQLTEASSADFVLYHYYATGDQRWPIIAIPGQAVYQTVGAARAAAYEEIKSLSFGQLDALTPESVPIATVIYETRSTYTNTVSSRIRSTDTGDDYIDWRGLSGSGTGGSGVGSSVDPDAIHDNVANEIAAVTIKAAPVGGDYLLIEDSAAGNVKKSTTIADLPVAWSQVSSTPTTLSGYGITDAVPSSHLGGNQHIDWTSATQNLSTSGTLSGSNLSGTNTGDQTSIVGITGTKSQFDTAVTDGNFLYVGDAVTSVGAGTGLSSSGGTTPSISLALTNLTTATTELVSTDFVICLDGTAERKVTLANFAAEMGAIGGWTTNTGTVTSVSVTTANGVSGSVANSTTTPAITLTLGAITPTSVGGITSANLVDKSASETVSGAWTFSSNLISGTTTSLRRNVDNSYLLLSGSTSATDGATLTLYGSTTATTLDDVRFQSSGVTTLYYDSSASEWDFKGNTVKAANYLASTEASGELVVGGATDGVNIYFNDGVADAYFRDGTTKKFGYDGSYGLMRAYTAIRWNNFTYSDYSYIGDAGMSGDIARFVEFDINNAATSSSRSNANGITMQMQAGVTLARGDVVCFNGSNQLVLADGDNASANPAVGIVVSGATSGSLCRILIYGLYFTSGLTAGSKYYLSTTPGDYTTTSGTQQIGYAVSTTRLYVNFMNWT